jgi:hypothetical protein
MVIFCLFNRENILFNFRDAWNSLKSMSKSQASKEYIQRVTDIQGQNNIENQVRGIQRFYCHLH